MAPRRVMPAPLMRSSAPIHSSMSGFTGFFTRTGMSAPLSESAISCMAKGLAVVRAPIHSKSMPALRAASTCLGMATSVAVSMPVSAFTRCSQGRAASPMPSNPPGLVRGFHTPARKILHPRPASWRAVFMTCSSVSALHGPAMTRGRLFSSTPGMFRGESRKSSISLVFVGMNQILNVARMRSSASASFSFFAQSERRM